MARPFVLPDLGEGLTEAEIIKVLVKEGDIVREDAPLLEVETDKAQVEIPSPLSGRVLTVHVQPGQSVRVGEALVTFADAAQTPAQRVPATASTPAPGRTAPTTGAPAAGGAVPGDPPRVAWPASWASTCARCGAPARPAGSPTTTCARRPPAAAPRGRADRSMPGRRAFAAEGGARGTGSSGIPWRRSGWSPRPCRASSSGDPSSGSPCLTCAAPSPSG